MAFIVRTFRQKWRWSERDRLGNTSWCSLKSSCFKLSALLDMSNCQAIATVTLSDWLRSLAPVFQPMRNKTKTNRTLHARSFPRCEQATDNCSEVWLVHRAVFSCCDWSEWLFGTVFSTVISKPLYWKSALPRAGTLESYSRNRK